ncbi:MAG: hypothetical protein MMC33_002591 [Icmadophila ericetorum]|nr:hypothetical protein [Icmadophila ericetorum]
MPIGASHISKLKYTRLRSDSECGEIRLLTVLPRYQTDTKSDIASAPECSVNSSADSPKLRDFLISFDASNKPDDSIVDCSLKVVDFNDEQLLYRALSYTWGSGIMKTIRVNSNVIEVTENLAEVLCYIQQDHHPVTLWVDAVCINQDDNAEKTEQVQKMRSIYERAAEVVVWVGPAADDSDVLMDAFDYLGKPAEDAGLLKLRGTDLIKLRKVNGESELSPELLAIKKASEELSDRVGLNFPFKAYKHFAARSYWKRVWIVQEISVARKVLILCGNKRLSFARFTAAIIFNGQNRVRLWKKATSSERAKMQVMMEEHDSAHNSVIGIRRRCQNETGTPETLVGLLVRLNFGHSYPSKDRATDVRDLIYGLMGMASDNDQLRKLGIQPDYHKSIIEAYTEITRGLIKNGDVLVLAWCQPSRQLKDLPSWVPDYSTPFHEPCCQPRYYTLFSASGKDSCRFGPVLDSDGKVLALKCVKIDTIKETRRPWHTGQNFDCNGAGRYLDDIKDLCSQRPAYASHILGMPQDFKQWEEAFWRVPTADQEHQGSRARISSTAILKHYHELREFAGKSSLESDFANLSNECAMYTVNLMTQHNRRPFISTEGLVGLVPSLAKEGDMVCIVQGATMPFVFRERYSGMWELIGEAFVHLVMDGEIMDTNPNVETFLVC